MVSAPCVLLVGARSILWSGDERGFSETARLRGRVGIGGSSGPGAHGRHLDAVRGHDRTVTGPISRRRLTDALTKGSAERPEAGEADVEADVGHAPLGLA